MSLADNSPEIATETAQRRTEAINLRRAGLSYAEIALRMGYKGGRAQVCMDIKRALEYSLREQHETVELYVQEEMERLDRLQAAAWTNAVAGDVASIGAILRIMEHRARLRPGMLAPVRVQAELTTIGDIEREIRDLAAELDRRANGATTAPAGEAEGAAGPAPAQAGG